VSRTKGTVIYINAQRRIIVVQQPGGFTLAELFGDKVQPGEVLSHEWDDDSGKPAIREGGERIDVLIQGTWGDLDAARAACDTGRV
jgi:hypothetical protein